MTDVISLQEFADRIVDPQYQQPLKSIDEALDANGWERVDFPECCGEKIHVDSFIGSAYFAECKCCGKFIVDVSGPRFGNGSVSLIDDKKVDMGDGSKRWIAGQKSATALDTAGE